VQQGAVPVCGLRRLPGGARHDGGVRHVLAISLLVLGLTRCDGGGEPRPSPVLTMTPIESDGPSGAPSSPATPGPSRSPSSSPVPHEPTDAERARFIRRHQPEGAVGLESVSVDLDGDAPLEIVVTYVVEAQRRSHLDVADWTGTEFAITASEPGGSAEQVADVRIDDVNGDGRTEIAVFNRVAAARSMTLFAVGDGGVLVALAGVGGCDDGSATYGDGEVALRDLQGGPELEIRALCEAEQRPRELWPWAVYVWDADAYLCDHVEDPSGSTSPC
jgi:hypothetical protein